MPSASCGSGRAARTRPTPATRPSKVRLANTTASSWSTSSCCVAPRWRRRAVTAVSPIAISSTRSSAGNSWDCGSLTTATDQFDLNHPITKSFRMATMNVHVSALTKSSAAEVTTNPAEKADGATASAFALDVLAGLGKHPKQLSPKYFYDSVGSDLFEQITRLPEYYPTRTELGILRDCGNEIAALLPKQAALVEFG